MSIWTATLRRWEPRSCLRNGDYSFEPGFLNPGVHSYEQSIEVTPSTSVVYEFQGDNPAYRSWRMPSLYSLGTVSSPSPITLTCASNAGTVGTSYTSSLTAGGGVPPYTFSITSGSLPPGLSLTPSTGAIAGVPTTPGTFPFTASRCRLNWRRCCIQQLRHHHCAGACDAGLSPQYRARRHDVCFRSGSQRRGTALHLLHYCGFLAGGAVTEQYYRKHHRHPHVEGGTFSFTASATDSTGTPAGKGSTNCSISSANPAPVVININTQTSSAIPAKFSGFSAPQPRNGVEYYDPKFLERRRAAQPWLDPVSGGYGIHAV